MPDKDYTFVPDLLQQVAPPDRGMTSCVLHKDERFNITLFGFAAGHGTAHFDHRYPERQRLPVPRAPAHSEEVVDQLDVSLGWSTITPVKTCRVVKLSGPVWAARPSC